MKKYNIELREVPSPKFDCPHTPVMLSDETMLERKNKVIALMKSRNLDQLIIYCDVEHGNNFDYLVGYFTRFEEALLVLNQEGVATLVLGNENLNKASKSRIEANAVHVSLFSLPNQPDRKDRNYSELLKEAGIKRNSKVGLVGWKMFTSSIENQKKLYDMPYYIVDEIRKIIDKDENISNETDLFIGENGTRTTNNANEIAHYEYGASLASDCILAAMNKVQEGVKETELGDALVRMGQHTNIVTIAASGPRFIKANMFPTDHVVKKGEPLALTVGYRGGSSSRSGFVVSNTEELTEANKDYLERVAKPYFAAYTRWLEDIKINMQGGALFEKIDEILPRSIYGWSLCPGHLTAEEEWMSSPIYENSTERLQSGMLFQIDIIPSIPGVGGVCAESTIVLANDELKSQIKLHYPELWERMEIRKAYIKDILGINLSNDVLPMCSTVAYLRPFFLNKASALTNIN